MNNGLKHWRTVGTLVAVVVATTAAVMAHMTAVNEIARNTEFRITTKIRIGRMEQMLVRIAQHNGVPIDDLFGG